jgi:hypothetical protein
MPYNINNTSEKNKRIAKYQKKLAVLLMISMVSKINRERKKTSIGMRLLAIGRVCATATWLGK